MKKSLVALLMVLVLASGCTTGAVTATPEQSSSKNRPPVASIDSISPETAAVGQKVTFKGHGTAANSTIATYKWRSDKDGDLNTLPQFESSKLSPGKHTIYFKVQDKNGEWSAEVQKKIEITTTSTPATTSTSTSTSTPTPTPAASHITTSPAPTAKITAFSGPPSGSYICPFSMDFSASITTDRACTVTYRWERSDGVMSPTQSITFYDAYMQTTNYSWVVSSSGDYWVRLHVLTPNEILSTRYSVSVTCKTSTITEVAVAGGSTSGVYKCPFNLSFSTSITVDGPCTVTYVWVRSDGTTSTPGKAMFPTAGTKTITHSWKISGSGEYWARLYTISPNEMKQSSYTTVTVTCK